MTTFSAIVLAGGQSKRFGSPKAEARFHGRPLIGLVVDAVAALTEEVVVVCAPGQVLLSIADDPRVRRADDPAPFAGPMAGVLTGLRAVHGEWVFVAGCDMPLLNPSILERLAAAREGADAVVPRVGGRLQPLAALYRRHPALIVLDAAWLEGERSLMDALGGFRVTELSEDELGPGLALAFRPVNTPDELRAIEELAAADDVAPR